MKRNLAVFVREDVLDGMPFTAQEKSLVSSFHLYIFLSTLSCIYLVDNTASDDDFKRSNSALVDGHIEGRMKKSIALNKVDIEIHDHVPSSAVVCLQTPKNAPSLSYKVNKKVQKKDCIPPRLRAFRIVLLRKKKRKAQDPAETAQYNTKR